MSEYKRYLECRTEIMAILDFFKNSSKYCVVRRNPSTGLSMGEPLTDFEIRNIVYDVYGIDHEQVQDEMDEIVRNAGKESEARRAGKRA